MTGGGEPTPDLAPDEPDQATIEGWLAEHADDYGDRGDELDRAEDC